MVFKHTERNEQARWTEVLDGSSRGLWMRKAGERQTTQQSTKGVQILMNVRVGRVHSRLVLCCITDEPLGVRESHIRRCCAVSLIITDNLYTIILPDTYAAVCCAEIDTNGRSLLCHLD